MFVSTSNHSYPVTLSEKKNSALTNALMFRACFNLPVCPFLSFIRYPLLPCFFLSFLLCRFSYLLLLPPTFLHFFFQDILTFIYSENIFVRLIFFNDFFSSVFNDEIVIFFLWWLGSNSNLTYTYVLSISTELSLRDEKVLIKQIRHLLCYLLLTKKINECGINCIYECL